MKLKESTQNVKKNMRNYETKRFFSFAKQLETVRFVFSQNDRNSAKQRPVSYSFVFQETKKNTKLSTLFATKYSSTGDESSRA